MRSSISPSPFRVVKSLHVLASANTMGLQTSLISMVLHLSSRLALPLLIRSVWLQLSLLSALKFMPGVAIPEFVVLGIEAEAFDWVVHLTPT
jgi:hypothetical protein